MISKNSTVSLTSLLFKRFFHSILVFCLFGSNFLLPKVSLADHYEVEFLARTYDASRNRTQFSYRVRGTGTSPALSHFVAALPQCEPPLTVVSTQPTTNIVGIDPTTSTYGIKWDFGIGTNATQDYKFWLQGNIPLGRTELVVKAGAQVEKYPVPGPACIDIDQDDDGIPDADEGVGDTDGDGIPDYLDLDSDDDGIPDVTEAGGIDEDGDGIIDGPEDRDNDGLRDVADPDQGGQALPNPDTDGDGRRDVLDLDSDDDGIPDVTEAGGVDTDGDGIIDNPKDDDRDGYRDVADPTEGGTPLANPDTDGDGTRDVLDLDSDDDGIPDVTEAGGLDANGDGVIDNPKDDDGDGYRDVADPTEGGTPLPNPDTDGDGHRDVLDLDSDDDGVPDVTEAGGLDANGDGVIDNPKDDDGDGYRDVADPTEGGTPLPNPDTDGDGHRDVLDLDSDDDGLPDVIEAGGIDENGDGLIDNPQDIDQDGFRDVADPTEGGTPLRHPDSDKDGIRDRLDIDSDDDGITDTTEARGPDADGDGRIDNRPDADRDGFSDFVDSTEGGRALPRPDTDRDSLFDHIDIDADRDGIVDNIEAQGENNYRAPLGSDSDKDGLDDRYDGDSGGLRITLEDTDHDLTPDYRDSETDSDGIVDSVEGHDVNQDGIADRLPVGGDADRDGLDDQYDRFDLRSGVGTGPNSIGTDTPLPDADSDNIRDWRDTDDDNDGIPTEDEKKDDPDGDGKPNYQDDDSDGDGKSDKEEGDDDGDNDGIPDYLDPPGDIKPDQPNTGCTGSPDQLKASDQEFAELVRVTWAAVSGAQSYEVWRSRFLGRPGEKLASNVVGTTYDDKSALAGVRYFYQVRALKDCGLAPFSPQDEGSAKGPEDCDGDGVADDVERQEGTDPCDPGDHLTHLTSPIYDGWNRFVNTTNILEVAAADRDVHAELTIYSLFGEVITTERLFIPAKSQKDTHIGKLVDDTCRDVVDERRCPVMTENERQFLGGYGMWKLAFGEEGPNGEIVPSDDARILGGIAQYSFGEHLQFAQRRPFHNTTRETAFALTNAEDPSGKNNLIANWIEVYNPNKASMDFEYTLKDAEGKVRFTKGFSVDGFGRRDIQGGHEEATDFRVFTASVRPVGPNASLPWFGHANRVGYDGEDALAGGFIFASSNELKRPQGTNAIYVPLFNGLLPLEEELCSSAETWVEVANMGDTSASFSSQFFDESGNLVESSVEPYSPGARFDFSARVLGDKAIGYAIFRSDTPGALHVGSALYLHNICGERANGRTLDTASTFLPVISGGNSLMGLANTFLNQENVVLGIGKSPSVTGEYIFRPFAGASSEPLRFPIVLSSNALFKHDILGSTATNSFGLDNIGTVEASLSGVGAHVDEGAVFFLFRIGLRLEPSMGKRMVTHIIPVQLQ